MEMVERAGERLAHLSGEISVGIVGRAIVLAVRRGELSLEKKLVARDAFPRQRLQRRTDASLVVVNQLVGRIDGAKAIFDRQLDQARRRLLFPGSAVHEFGN